MKQFSNAALESMPHLWFLMHCFLELMYSSMIALRLKIDVSGPLVLCICVLCMPEKKKKKLFLDASTFARGLAHLWAAGLLFQWGKLPNEGLVSC